MPHAINNPDDLLIVLFKNLALENEDKTKLAGRPIFDDVEAGRDPRPRIAQ